MKNLRHLILLAVCLISPATFAKLPTGTQVTRQISDLDYQNLNRTVARLESAKQSNNTDVFNATAEQLRAQFISLRDKYGASALSLDEKTLGDSGQFRAQVIHVAGQAANDNCPRGMDFVGRRIYDLIDKAILPGPPPIVDQSKICVLPVVPKPSFTGFTIM